MSSFWWLFDLIASFKFQLAIGTLLVSILMGFYRFHIPAAIGFVFGLMSIYQIYNLFSSSSRIPSGSSEIEILSANLLSSNRSYDAFKEYIVSTDPDVLLLMEYTADWDRELSESLSTDLPYNIKKIQNDNFGISLRSRFPIISQKVFDITNSYFPMIEAQIKIDSDTVTIVGLHLENPVGAGNSATRKLQVDGLVNRYQNYDKLILLGDFNMTPYSSDYDHLCTKLGLKETRSGILPTFPSYFWPLMIPIDHCLVDESFECTSIKSGPNIGSDHLPLEIVLSL